MLSDLPRVTVSKGQNSFKFQPVFKVLSSLCITLCLKEIHLILAMSNMTSLQGIECLILGMQIEVCQGR